MFSFDGLTFDGNTSERSQLINVHPSIRKYLRTFTNILLRQYGLALKHLDVQCSRPNRLFRNHVHINRIDRENFRQAKSYSQQAAIRFKSMFDLKPNKTRLSWGIFSDISEWNVAIHPDTLNLNFRKGWIRRMVWSRFSFSSIWLQSCDVNNVFI